MAKTPKDGIRYKFPKPKNIDVKEVFPSLKDTPDSELFVNTPKTSPFDQTIDEMLANPPLPGSPRVKRALNDEIVYKLASYGNSLLNICDLFDCDSNTFYKNKKCVEAFKNGRANIAIRNRVAIVQHAAEGNLQASIYIDKMIGGDKEESTVNVNVQERPLKDINTSELFQILLPQSPNDKEQSESDNGKDFHE